MFASPAIKQSFLRFNARDDFGFKIITVVVINMVKTITALACNVTGDR
jgi:hypothetical protein